MSDQEIPSNAVLEDIEDAKGSPTEQATPELDEQEKRRRSFERSLAGPSVGKAGLIKDQAEINRVIAEASKVRATSLPLYLSHIGDNPSAGVP
jgi:hypothetical protein